MGDEDTRRGDLSSDAPGLSYLNMFVGMEEFLDKLKLLNYEAEFCYGWGFKQFSR